MQRRDWLTLGAAGAASVLLGGCGGDAVDLGDTPLAKPHWRVRALLALGEPLDATRTLTPAQQRADFDERIRKASFAVEDPEEVASTSDMRAPTDAGEVPVRIYTPMGASGPRPVIVHFHGGAFVVGGLFSHDTACRALCNRAQAIVVAVDYRLAPEAPFPAGLDDCYAVTQWASTHAAEFGGIPGAVALYGDSAGGCLAAGVTLLARERQGPPIAAQVLVYPVTTLQMDQPSVQQFATGYFLEKSILDAMVLAYAPNPADVLDPHASPLLAADLRGLPPAMIITAGFDPLRDQGVAYATALRRAGVRVEHRNYRGMIHGFALMTALLPDARDARDRSAAFVRAAFG
jgi:acetyl esterase